MLYHVNSNVQSIAFQKSVDVPLKANVGHLLLQCVERKRLFDIFTQYSSFTSFSYKVSFIKCLIYREFKISSSYVIFLNRINKIKNVLQTSVYSNHYATQRSHAHNLEELNFKQANKTCHSIFIQAISFFHFVTSFSYFF